MRIAWSEDHDDNSCNYIFIKSHQTLKNWHSCSDFIFLLNEKNNDNESIDHSANCNLREHTFDSHK